MNEPDFAEHGTKLHQRLVSGDLTATAEIAELFFGWLAPRLERQYARTDPLLISAAINEALFGYLTHPSRYDPTRASLPHYLYRSAEGDLLNLLEREQKEMAHLRIGADVALDAPEAEYTVEPADDFDLEAEILNRTSPLWAQLKALLPDERDQTVLRLMMETVRETSAYAEVLGIGDRGEPEQREIVKRHKDRIRQMVKRHIRRSELDENG